MKAGNLVRFSPPSRWDDYGLVIKVISECLVEVMWAGKEYVYMEPVDKLEVVQ